MIPSDVAARLQLTADAAVARAPTVQQVSDALADLVPGQRVLAEITSRLPTGAYRALINQRDVTLALPFSAKAGDALELEVVDNGGRLMLAVVARKEAEPGGGQAPVNRPAAETILSRAGSLISGLMAKPEDGEPAKPAQLNANQPIANAPPARGAELVPLLRQAITQSGMFYESHQVQWATNRLPVEALLVQPQGRLSPALLRDLARFWSVYVVAGAWNLATLPVLVGYLFGVWVLKMNPALLLGAITGARTCAPAMDVVNEAANSSIPALGYAGTYAVANVMLTLAGSFIIGFWF